MRLPEAIGRQGCLHFLLHPTFDFGGSRREPGFPKIWLRVALAEEDLATLDRRSASTFFFQPIRVLYAIRGVGTLSCTDLTMVSAGESWNPAITGPDLDLD